MIPIIVYVLLAAHFVADFLCQSDWMALNKSKRWDALAVHVGTYALVLYVFLAAFGLWTVWPPASVAWRGVQVGATNYGVWWHYGLEAPAFYLAMNAAAHFVQDAITSRITSRLWFVDGITLFDFHGNAVDSFDRAQSAQVAYGDTRHWFFVAIGFDQLLHYVTLFVTANWWLR